MYTLLYGPISLLVVYTHDTRKTSRCRVRSQQCRQKQGRLRNHKTRRYKFIILY